ncbi:DUF4166 domain-containing protein [Halobacillus andaensis]|uniref:DUF4166 domain-containing protein n=1 Tax=Halobacillus andaensis TaxID=1176239 RepID=UPI003D73919C
MSIYKRVLGRQFYDLHPMLQRRYESAADGAFHGSGVMRNIIGGPKWLYPLFFLGTKWKLLFPDSGQYIPFTIKNTSKTGKNGEPQVHWERIFHFNKKSRYFNALMSLDESQNIIKDYLGEPPLIYSDLTLRVNHENSLIIESKKQRLVLGKWEFPLPRLFQGLAEVSESYSEKEEAYHISVDVRNPVLGRLFYYEGEFKENGRR